MAAPDNLLFLDSDAVNSSLASVPMEQNEPTHVSDNQTDDSYSSMPDQHTNAALESTGLKPVPCRDETMETHSQHNYNEGENESSLVLTQHMDHTGLTEMTINDEKSDNCDFDTSGVMENDNSTNLNPDLIHHIGKDSVMKRILNDKQTDLNHEDETYGSLIRQQEMRQDTILHQYSSSEGTGIENSQTANDAVSDAKSSEQSPDQPFSIASNDTDKTTSECSIQTCWDTVESAATSKTQTEMHDVVKNVRCESFTTSQTLNIEDLNTDISVCLTDLPETDSLNILTPASTLLGSLGKNSNVLETADVPINDSEMVQSINKDLASSNAEISNTVLTQTDQNFLHVIDHDVKVSQSNSTETVVDQYVSSENIGLEVSQAESDDKDLNNSVQSNDQQLSTANSETEETSSEFHTQTCQDIPEGVIIAEEAMTGYNTLPERHDIADVTTSQTPKMEDPKIDVPTYLPEHKADTPNLITTASTLSDTLEKHDSIFETTDVPVSDCEMIQTVTLETVTTYKTLPMMHGIAEDLTCCDFTTSEIPKIEEPETNHPICLDDLHEANTPNIFPHASALLDSLGMNNNFLETADVPVSDSEIIHTVNKDLDSSSVEFCTVILTQTDPKDLQDSDLDGIKKTESNRIDDSIDRMIDTEFSLDASKLQPSPACSNDPSGTMIHSESLFSQSIPDSPQIGEKYEKDLSQGIPLPRPVTNEDLGNCSGEIDDACLKFTGTERDVEGDSELWLEPSQFLAGEEDEGAIFDKWGRSCSPSPPTTHPDNTKASDYTRRENISIDHNSEDWELAFPPVERWSSSDSWASALSDWFQAVNTYPEDSFTSASTLSTGSKLGMAIQDNILEQRTSSDNANNVEQTCLSLNLLEPDEPGQALGRGLVKSDNTNGTLFKQGDKERLASRSDMEKDTTTMETQMSLFETTTQSESHKADNNAVMETFNASSVHEFNAKLHGSQDISGELLSAKPEGNVLVEVTGGKVSQLGLVFEEERQSSFPSPRSSAYTRDKNLSGCVSNEERRHSSNVHLCICPSQSDSHASSKAGHAEGNRSFLHSNIGDCTVKPYVEENIPQFIMPFASLCTGNTFLQHSFLKEDRSQAELDLPDKRYINEINLKSSKKSSSSDDSSEDHFHTCPDQSLSSSCGDSDDPSIKDTSRKPVYSDKCDISKELSKLLLLTGERFMVSENKRIAYVTLDLDELPNCEKLSKPDNMPHKTSKTSSDGKMRSKHKEKPDDKQQHGIQASKKQDLQPQSQVKNEGADCEDCPVAVIETIVITEKIVPKTQGKKKKKHVQHGTSKPENYAPTDVRSESRQKNANGKAENLELKVASNGLNKPASHPSAKTDITKKDSILKVMSVRPKVEPSMAKMDPVSVNATQKSSPIKLKVDTSNTAKTENKTCTSDSLSTCLPSMLNDDIKRRRVADDLSGAVPIRTRPQLPAIFRQARKDGEDVTRRAYSEVVKQKSSPPKEVVVPRVVSEIQADPVPADPQNISLWCQFSPVPPDATIKWTKEAAVLSEINKVEKEDGRFTLTIIKACSKDLGFYKCSLNAANISVSTSEYHLTSEVLMELVIPSHDQTAEPRVMDGDEENIQCSPLLFKEDFLSDQYFGKNQPASILTEKVHFGEGMHRKAFRTTFTEGNLPRFRPGHHCVLKVHNSISYGTKNNEELVQKNYSLAVEECHVQNTAREYIKAYNSVAKSAQSFGDVPEIIPIYLVHRPSNDIPYATLEEELLGDFVKYSVKDGKEINLMRRDSEAGQKCCAFQHWVYTQTEGNLLVTDMQGVGMKLTDVGIATCKKGYKGFRGNCATSFIDQFKALHQCNRYCELLGLVSLQPKPKRTVVPPKPKTQPVPKKKTFGPVLNAKS